MSGLDLPDSVMLRLPPEWEDFPLDGAEASAHAAAVAESFLAENDVTRTDARRVESAMRHLQRFTKRTGVSFVSYLLAHDEGGDDGDPVLVHAAVCCRAVTRAEMGTSVPLMADVLIAAISEESIDDDPSISYTDIEPPAKVTLGERDAVRLLRLASFSVDQGDPLRVFTESFLVPGRTGDVVVLVQFSTLNFEHANEFSQLFGNIIQTLRILYPSDPTFVDDDLPPIE